jgi:hypothetical protein
LKVCREYLRSKFLFQPGPLYTSQMSGNKGRKGLTPILALYVGSFHLRIIVYSNGRDLEEQHWF